MTPSHRTLLLETQYALDALVWSYRSRVDQAPTEHLTAEHLCLSDFAFRTAVLVRDVLDADNRRRGPELAFRPPGQDADRALAAAIQARRRARAAKNATAPTTTAAPEPRLEPMSPDDAGNDETLTPDAISPSRLPLRRRC